jgi:hypothetical protein
MGSQWYSIFWNTWGEKYVWANEDIRKIETQGQEDRLKHVNNYTKCKWTKHSN